MLFRSEEKVFLKGVTYGPFGPGTHGAQLPEKDVITRDLALMRELGANMLRVFTVPPRWFADMCHEAGVGMLIGVPWTQHVAFLDSRAEKNRIRQAIRDGVTDWLGLSDDRATPRLQWRYEQRRGPRGAYGVEILLAPMEQ